MQLTVGQENHALQDLFQEMLETLTSLLNKLIRAAKESGLSGKFWYRPVES